MGQGWIGVDLDGTLARYDGWFGGSHIGEPIEPMLERVKHMLAEGVCVKIFTARVSSNNSARQQSETAIRAWCLKHLGVELEVTAEKDYNMIEFWDDRCMKVEFNTGRLLA